MNRGVVFFACLVGAYALRCSLLTDTSNLVGSASDASSQDAPASVSAGDASADASSIGEIYASQQTGAFGLARVGNTLYWTSATGVSSCPIDSCAAPTVVMSGGKATAIAALDRPYWITEGQTFVSYIDTNGKNGSLALSSPGVWVATSADTAFVCTANAQIVRLQGNPPGGSTTFLGFDPQVDRAAAIGGAVAWTSSKTSSVGYCGKGGCTANGSVVSQMESPIAIALDSSILFWTTTDGDIRSAAHDGSNISSPVKDVVSGLAEPSALAPDTNGPYLYFAARGTAANNYLDGVVGKVLKAGGMPTILARAQARPASVLLTDTQVYWTNEYDGTIRRAPK